MPESDGWTAPTFTVVQLSRHERNPEAPRDLRLGSGRPEVADIDAFARNLQSSASWLAPFNGFGPDNFLVGTPQFDFGAYQGWVSERFAPRHFRRLVEKMDYPALYAVGAFIQALGQNPGLEQILRTLGSETHVYVGTGLGSLHTIYRESVALHERQARWDEFWAGRGEELQAYLDELAAIDNAAMDGSVETGKLHVIREKEKNRGRLQERWNAPEPPWAVSPDLIWNIQNTPAAQISILGRIIGLTFAPVAACSTFGVALNLAMNAIRAGQAKAAVVGATDPPPHPLTRRVVLQCEGPFGQSKRVASPDTAAGHACLRGSRGLDRRRPRLHAGAGVPAAGMEIVGLGVSSDAHHIITPSTRRSAARHHPGVAGCRREATDVTTWDHARHRHARRRLGDRPRCESLFPGDLLVTARKGTFGHGMSRRRRLGTDRSVPRLRGRPPVSHTAGTWRAECRDRPHARPLRLRRAARCSGGAWREALDGHRRHQRLRRLATD